MLGHPPTAELTRDPLMPESVIVRRKRLLYRSRYRGCLESDLLLSRFAERHLAALDATQLDRYEGLLGESDHDLLAWIGGQRPVPERHDHEVFRLLQGFRPNRSAG
jgi:antitoxin CptB